jgi:hypothetical protein
MASERTARRLGLLEGLRLSPVDVESIVAEFENFDQALRELETFAEGVPWPSLPIQPDTNRRSKHDRG